jgi:hypothetical protein
LGQGPRTSPNSLSSVWMGENSFLYLIWVMTTMVPHGMTAGFQERKGNKKQEFDFAEKSQYSHICRKPSDAAFSYVPMVGMFDLVLVKGYMIRAA